MEVKDITSVFKDVYEGDISAEEAKKEIELASPLQLTLAEVELLDNDIDESDLKKFRNVYTKIIAGGAKESLEDIDEGHPMHPLISEHIEISNFVEELANFSDELRNEKNRIIRKNKLDNIENKIKMIKRHVKSEEEIFFPKFEDGGFHDSLYTMKNEHKEIKELIDEMMSLSEELVENKDEFIKKADVLTYTLDFHSLMENNFIYKGVLEKLDERGK